MSAELLVRCNHKMPKIPLVELRQKLADSLGSCPSAEASSHGGFAFDGLGIAVSVTPDQDGNLANARVQVSDSARIGHVSEVFKTFITLGWAL